jgi:nucleotide-binding universal stress UspA family protein
MDVARELGADLVVVGSGDRSSEVGPVAELVALTAPCSVLVVKCPIGAHRELGPFGPDAPR